jgi:hypothetical protein
VGTSVLAASGRAPTYPSRRIASRPSSPRLADPEQHADERRADRGKQTEPGQDSAESGSTPREEDVSEGPNAGQANEKQFHEERCAVGVRLITDLHGEQIPYAGDDEDPERRPGDELKATGYGTRGLDAAEPTRDGYDTREHDLSADPYRRGEDVQEQPDRRGMYGQHEGEVTTRV